VHFYYHMYGRDMGQLKVFRTRGPEFSADDADVWSISGEQGDTWKMVSVDVDLVRTEDRVSAAVYDLERDNICIFHRWSL